MENEQQNIEYKRIWKDDVLKEISGFANAQGGKVYIGIDDDHTIVGVPKIKEQLEDIPNKIVTLLGIVPEVNHVVMDGKDVVEIIVSTSNIPIPYRGVYYQRSGATKQELRGTALHDFLLSKMGVHWEDMACQRASLDDIDEDAIAYFLRKGIEAHRIDPEVAQYSKEQVLDNLELMEDGKPTNAAIMLFGKRPSRFFSTLDYKIGRFGSSNTDLRHQDMIVSNLITLGDKIMRLLSDNYLIHPIHYEGWTRMEPLEIPEEALREIVYNSIIHRDQRGAWTQMSIYDDHIRLWNDGVLPVGYTVDTLLGKHTSKPRNPTIAKIFYMAGFIEAWGRGIEKIVEGFTKENLTPPTFVVEQGGITVTILRERFMAINKGNGADQKPTRNRPETDPNVTKDVTKDVTKEISERQRNILALIASDETITTTKMSQKTGVERRTIQRDIEELQKAGILVREGGRKDGRWVIVSGC